ncbi:MAG: hypothetical protein WD042_08495 [Phycisphaeraceae bacterium]
MPQKAAFADVLESAEQLDDEAQAELVDILNRRLAERGRQRLIAAVAQSRREFAAGKCKAMTPAQIMREAKQ